MIQWSDEMFAFWARLQNEGVSYTIAIVRRAAVMFQIATPGYRWEIEFFDTGEIEVERFAGGMEVAGREGIAEFWVANSDVGS